MPNVTIDDLLAAQKAVVSTVSGIGVVLTRERYVDDEAYISLFTSLNPDGAARGVMILWSELVSQDKGPLVCTVQQRHRFSYEIMEPYDDSRSDGKTSHEVFVARIEAVNNALNEIVGTEAPWALGLNATFPDADVEHQFLQGDGPIVVRRWGTGPKAAKTHYASFTMDILVVVTVH